MFNKKLLRKFIIEALKQADYSIVNDLPIDPDDLDQNGEIEDNKLDKYDASQEDELLKDKNCMDEFSSCGGSVMGYVSNNQKR